MNNSLFRETSHRLRLLRPAKHGEMRGLVKIATHVFMSNWMKQLAAFCLGVFIARMYGAEGKGVYFLLTAGTSLLGVVLSLGLNNSAIYHIKHRNISASRGLVVVLANSLIVAGISAFFLFLFKDQVWALLFETVTFSYFYLVFVVVYIPVVLMTLFLVSYYLATHEIAKHRVLIGTAPVVTLVLTILFAITGNSDVNVALAVLFLVEMSYVVFFSLDIYRNTPSHSAKRLRLTDMYSFALRGYAGSLGNTVLTQVDAMVVAAFNSPVVLGYYSVSKSLYRVLLSIPQAFNGLLLGTYCDIGPAEARRMNIKVIFMMAIVLIFCMLLALLLGGPFVLLVYGKEFAPAIPALNILLFAALFMGISSSSIPLFLACGHPGLISNISLISGVVSVAMTFILVPYFSIEGAAVATLVGSICFLIMRMYYGRKIYVDASSAETNGV